MPSEQEMKAALQKYIDAFQERDADALAALFAEDATVEDPVGSEVLRGKEAITAFYRKAVLVVTHMALSTPIRGSHGNAAAMAFDFEMNLGGRKVKTSAIDVMEFDADGKIKTMRAYWGKGDSKVAGSGQAG